MSIFSGHRLIKEEDGYILVLQIDLKSEFSASFGKMGGDREEALQKLAEQYIAENLSGIRIKTVKIVAGSLLVAALTLSPIRNTFAETGYRTHPSYIVQQGDTLYEIAQKFHVTVDDLKGTNSLSSNMIYPGQSFNIPGTALPDGVYGSGSSGQEVRLIQECLSSIGYKITIDGIYGLKTRETILNLQRKFPEIKADGIYGPQTRAKIEAMVLSSYHIVKNPHNLLVLVNKQNSLPYDFVPEDLVVPSVPFPFAEMTDKKLMRREAAQALEALFRKAQAEGIQLYALSGYRSYDRQADIFARNYSRTTGANLLSARPGESEHQTGLAMDMTSPKLDYRLSQALGNLDEGKWLVRNAPLFGFIIRYPAGSESITGYSYEPWHIRYVGKTAAIQISQQHLTLEEYLK